jgi:putative intracellular protease/amidase
MSTVIFPIPSRDFDPTEIAVSWQILKSRGHKVIFATPDGKPGEADAIMIDGIGLDRWSRVPILRNLRVIGLVLRANRDARRAYRELLTDSEFAAPQRWDALRVQDFDGLLLGGGHRARGMREYIDSPVVQKFVADFFASGKPIAAICHGVLLAARSRDAAGRSVLHGRRTTALTWKQERTASALAHFGRPWDRNYYRTYPETAGQAAGFMSVEAEVKRALASPDDFIDVPTDDPTFTKKTSGLWRDTLADSSPAWVVHDGNYISARWPGDVHTFAGSFSEMLDSQGERELAKLK